jgi:hypothetical protein
MAEAETPRPILPPSRGGIRRLQDIPNVGPATVTGQRHDPCVYDVFLAAVRFMEGAPALPWWTYTPERKRVLAERAREQGRPRRR